MNATEVRRITAFALIFTLLLSTAPITTAAQAQEPLDITDSFGCGNFLAHVRDVLVKGENEPILSTDVEYIGILHVSGMDITCLSGIEHFVGIRSITAGDNRLTRLDLSNNPELSSLVVYENQLTELDLSNNPYLFTLWVSGNKLTQLDISYNKFLRVFAAADNQLSFLDVSENHQLILLDVRWNNMQSPDDILGRFATQLFLREEHFYAIPAELGLSDGIWFWPQLTAPAPAGFAPEQPPPRWGWLVDVQETDWFYDYVADVVINIFGNSQPGMFGPHINMSRALFEQLMAFFEQLAGDLPEYDLSLTHLTVSREEMVARLYSFAIENGVLFPEHPIALLIPFLIGVPPEYTTVYHPDYGEIVLHEFGNPFTDEHNISDWAIEAVRVMQISGVIRGYPDGSFDPQAPVTRAEGAAIFMRFLMLLLLQPRQTPG